MACLKYSVWFRDEQEGSKGRTVYHEITFLMNTLSTGTEHTSQLSKSYCGMLVGTVSLIEKNIPNF